jgi:hypothetical protein
MSGKFPQLADRKKPTKIEQLELDIDLLDDAITRVLKQSARLLKSARELQAEVRKREES